MFSGVLSEAQAVMVTCSWAVEAMLDLKFHRVILEFSNRVLHAILKQGNYGSAFGPGSRHYTTYSHPLRSAI